MLLLYILDLFGTFVFAITGALSGVRNRMDLFGIIFLGFVTGVGGGTVRDVFMGSTPVFWMHDLNYLIVILLASVLTFALARFVLRIHSIILVADAIGLGTFTLIGIEKSLSIGLNPVIAVIMGMFTGVLGGVMRDVFSNRVPLIFTEEIYATASLMGGGLFFLLKSLNMHDHFIYIATVVFVISARLVAIRLKLALPRPPE